MASYAGNKITQQSYEPWIRQVTANDPCIFHEKS